MDTIAIYFKIEVFGRKLCLNVEYKYLYDASYRQVYFIESFEIIGHEKCKAQFTRKCISDAINNNYQVTYKNESTGLHDLVLKLSTEFEEDKFYGR